MNIKTFTIVVAIAALLGMLGLAAAAQDDIEIHRECHLCGMDRKAFAFSRMLLRYKDGTEVGVCSLHCAVEEMRANKDREITSILVADRDTKKLIDAEKAIWVMGGKKHGVMTQRPKWAFATREAAMRFVEAYGGKIAGWEEALSAAQDEAMSETNH